MIACADLGEESPVAMVEEVDEEETGCGKGLTEGLGLPIGELSHGRVGMLVIDRINKVARRGTEVRRLGSCGELRLSGGERSAFHACRSLQPHRKKTPVKTNPPKTSSKPRRVAA